MSLEAAVLDSGYKQIARGLYLEGLAFDAGRDMVWYSDVIAGGVHGVGIDGTPRFHLNQDRMWTGGVMMNQDGAVLSSGPGGIMWNKPEEGSSGWLVKDYEGAPLMGVNEMVSDANGGIYFGTIDVEKIATGGQPDPSSIFHLTNGWKLTQIAEPLGFANGIMLSADGRQLYCNSTFDGTYSIAVGGDGGFGERVRLLEKPDCDGMALDGDGNLLITGFKSGRIVRVAPDGSMLGAFETPAAAVTQLRFGGTDMRDVYLACVPIDAGESLKAGDKPTEERSFLLRGRVEKPGLPLAPANFDI